MSETGRGIEIHTLKSGEYRNRALRVARGMDVTLRGFSLSPAGKGHLTKCIRHVERNRSDRHLGLYLNDRQIEFVIVMKWHTSN